MAYADRLVMARPVPNPYPLPIRQSQILTSRGESTKDKLPVRLARSQLRRRLGMVRRRRCLRAKRRFGSRDAKCPLCVSRRPISEHLADVNGMPVEELGRRLRAFAGWLQGLDGQ